MLLKLAHVSLQIKKKMIVNDLSFILHEHDFLTLTGPKIRCLS